MSPIIEKDVLLNIIDNLEYCNIVELSKQLHCTIPDCRKILKIHDITLEESDEDLIGLAEYSIYNVMNTGNNTEKLVAAKFVLSSLKKKYKNEDSDQAKLISALIANAEGKSK